MSDTELSGKHALFELSARPASLVPPLAVIGLELLLLMIFSYQTELDQSVESLLSKLFWHNATVRPPILLVLIVIGWGVVVRVSRTSGLNIDHVLGGRCMPPANTYCAALWLLCVVLFAHLVHVVASSTPGLTWRPWLTCNVALHAALLVLGTMPAPVFFAESRFSLLRTLHESFIAPLAPVNFWHVIVADYLTSLAKAFADLQSTACITTHILSEPRGTGYTPTSVLWEQYNAHCADTYANALMLALPFWLRLMQCLKVYSVTREKKNLWNALKYSTAFPLVAAGALRKHRPSLKHDRLFILCAVVQSSYCYFWDVQMDWGLFVADRTATCGYRLREPLLVTRKRWVYALICVFNFGLRFIWALSVFNVVPGRGRGMFLLESVEILRRTVWAIFRIEWEVVVKVYNASYVTLPLNSPVSGDLDSDSRSSTDETQTLTGGHKAED